MFLKGFDPRPLAILSTTLNIKLHCYQFFFIHDLENVFILKVNIRVLVGLCFCFANYTVIRQIAVVT